MHEDHNWTSQSPNNVKKAKQRAFASSSVAAGLVAPAAAGDAARDVTGKRLAEEVQSWTWMENKEEEEGGFKGKHTEGDSDRAYRVRVREGSQHREGAEAADGRRGEEERH